MTSGRVVVVGSSNTDMVVRVPRLPAAGETVLGGAFAVLPGGKGANQAVAAARLGAQVTFVGCVGSDDLGDRALAGLAAEGLDTHWFFRSPEAPSGVALILVGPDGENQIAVAPGANALLTPAAVEAAAPAFERADVVLAQLEVPVDTVAAAVRLARACGKRVILNPAPAQPLPADLLARVDLLVPNETEAAQLAGAGEARGIKDDRAAGAEDAARALLAHGVGGVIVTLGSEGAVAVTPEECWRVPARRVRAVDSTAAGDAFCGALAAALAGGRDLRAAVEFGIAAAGISVSREGAQPSLPTLAEVEALFPG